MVSSFQVLCSKVCIYFKSSYVCYIHNPSHPAWFDQPNNILQRIQIKYLLVMWPDPPCCYFLSLRCSKFFALAIPSCSGSSHRSLLFNFYYQYLFQFPCSILSFHSGRQTTSHLSDYMGTILWRLWSQWLRTICVIINIFHKFGFQFLRYNWKEGNIPRWSVLSMWW